MVENESLWQAAARCHEVLAAAEIPHAVLGGVAVCLHGYQRNTVDVDVLVRRVDADAVRVSLDARVLPGTQRTRNSARRPASQFSFFSPAIRRGQTAKSGCPIPAMIAPLPKSKVCRFFACRG